jgi:hypothetical protein
MSEDEVLAIYDLIDVETGSVAGAIRGDGVVVTGDGRLRDRVADALAHEVMVRDGDLVEELGVCFLDVETLCPGETGHVEIVIRNLGRLAGYLPRRRMQRD